MNFKEWQRLKGDIVLRLLSPPNISIQGVWDLVEEAWNEAKRKDKTTSAGSDEV